EGKDSGGVGQACIDSAPALAAVGALEDPAEVASKVADAREDCGWSLGIDGQGPDFDPAHWRWAPGRPAVGASEDFKLSACVERGGGVGVDGERLGAPSAREAPGAPAIRALVVRGLDAAHIEHCWSVGEDGQGSNHV